MLSSLKIASKALRANKGRTALAILGIVIGIASVIIVFSAGEGIRRLVVGQVEAFGTNIIETELRVPKKTATGRASDTEQGMAQAQGVQVTTLKIADMDDIDKLPNVARSYAGILGQEQVSYANELKKSFLFGTSASYIDIDQSEIGAGRFFTDAEDRSLMEVAVLGAKIKEKLFGDSDPLGQSIRIRKQKFRVIGVMEERGAMAFMNFDDYVYVPIRTLQKKVMGIDHVMYMIHELNDVNLADETAEQIRLIVRENHNITDPDRDDFAVITMAEMMKILDTVTGALTLLLLAIVAISLVVGGVGVMNIMYVMVSERTPEIGLRKSIGAKYKDIMAQFLFESILITLTGAVIGIVFGIIVSWFISLLASNFGLAWEFAVPIRAYPVAIGFSLLFGLAFGLYPARKAARLDPVEALRRE
ncbi:MAG: ABC transporter permease [Patescibacteria group bacterium]|jgi:putative ABC transport system permease protein